jgi:molybdopterin molybdotransferase
MSAAGNHNDCDAGQQRTKPLGVEQALEVLLARARPLTETETLPLARSRGRVLAEPLASTVDLPPWDNSAMDGYALRAEDAATTQGRLPVSQRVPAGSSAEPLAPRTAARIFTGAPVPAHADTVVVQESCQRDGDFVIVPAALERGTNIRRRAEDVRAGDTVIAAGTRLSTQQLGLAASVGAARVRVYRRLRVAFFASGDELTMPGEPLSPGKIYNSNRFLFQGLLEDLGCDVIDLGTVPDTFDATAEALRRGAEQADLVMASGGVSVGEEDHVRPAVQQIGTLDLWNVAMRPGKPLAFGHIGDTPFIGSPGNPVSLFVTFCLFARPFILRMQGVERGLVPTALRVRAGFDWPTPGKRREYHRARITTGADGIPVAEIFESRSSASLRSLAWAGGLVDIAAGTTVTAGDSVVFLPLCELLG